MGPERSTDEAGEHSVAQSRLVVHLPVLVEVRVGVRLELLAEGAEVGGGFVGVEDLEGKTFVV